MSKMSRFIAIAVFLVLVGTGLLAYSLRHPIDTEEPIDATETDDAKVDDALAIPDATKEVMPTTSSRAAKVVLPIAGFESRITKKPFGIYITPATSPVQPERFTGYHTGADVEYGDVSEDVPVMALSRGTVVLARWASGYGGVVVIQHTIDGEAVQSLYGHLDPARLPAVGAEVAAGERIGFLGKGGTAETDGERKHLHFGIVKGTATDIRGYVANESELSKWYDPVAYLGSRLRQLVEGIRN